MSKKIIAKKIASKTHGVFILDKSGSMAGLREQVVTAFNEQVQQLRILAKSQPAFCSLITFNGDVEEVRWKEDANTFPEATIGDYLPAGATALYDAMGYTLSKLQREDDGDTSYLVIVQSDGETNSDCKFTPSAVQELVKSCENSERYTIVYIGCDEDVIREVVRNLGIHVSNTAKMDTSSFYGYNSSMGTLNYNTRKYAAARASGLCNSTANYCSSSVDKIADLAEGVPASPDLVIGGGNTLNLGSTSGSGLNSVIVNIDEMARTVSGCVKKKDGSDYVPPSIP